MQRVAAAEFAQHSTTVAPWSHTRADPKESHHW